MQYEIHFINGETLVIDEWLFDILDFKNKGGITKGKRENNQPDGKLEKWYINENEINFIKPIS